ncbi:MAG: agmatine deiminase family protein [Solirubrobacterales bacterium]|nr:agmatine deiminase family protein [Solirubrobacterales bacterium]
MPAETAPQERVWMSYPVSGASALGDDPEQQREARAAWSAVANAIVEFEPVTVIADPSEYRNARATLDPRVELLTAPLDDSWMRDCGPTFVHAADGSVAAVNWVFNGWGAQQWARWGRDEKIGSLVAELAGVPRVDSDLVNEGGGIVVDGNGTVVLTDTVQLDPGRNPDLSRAQVEAEITGKTGARQVIWLKRGLHRDSREFGTRGHADILVAFPSPGTVLVHAQNNPEHPDYEVSREIREVFGNGTDADGSPWRIVDLPAPVTLRDEEDFVDYSYINHLVINRAVIACVFDDPADPTALEILAAEYPGRTIVPIRARPIFDRGGGVHCITQQQPAPLFPAQV